MAANLCEGKIYLCTTSSPGECQKKGRLTIQCDELWSFVDNKGNKQWVWLALDVVTGEKQLVFILEQEMKRQHSVCRTLYLRFIANVPSLTLISG